MVKRALITAGQWWEQAARTFVTVTELLRRAQNAELRDQGHECGHQFEVSVRVCGHTGIVGEGPESHRDDDWWSEPSTTTVRAHNQRDALLLAAARPLHEWHPWADEEEPA